MNRPGPAGQPMRGMPGFPSQPSQVGRATSRGGGSAPGWGFGVQNGSSGSGQALNPPQGRGVVGQSSFAQSLGGAQSTSLDLSEFPSLTGSAQPQFPNAGQQAAWSSQRGGQQGPIQRGQQLPATALGANPTRGGPSSAQEHAQQSLDEAFFPSSAPGSSLDDFRHGGLGSVGQMPLGSQHQSGIADEFPPLGRRGHGELGQDRRLNVMSNAVGGSFSSASNFPSEPNSRVAADSVRPAPERVNRMQANGNNNNNNNNNNDSSIFSDLHSSSQLHMAGRDANGPGGAAAAAAAATTTTTSAVSSPNGGVGGGGGLTRAKSPSQMSDRERYGLSGLLEQIRTGDADSSNLAIGMDLTNLGLDLNSSEPLYPTFAGPFANGPTRPLQPDFVLPACYAVTNIHPIEEKIGSLSDETLFFIFYTMTRDVMQEQAAVELTHRNWRYHKVLQIWITKEQGYADPQPIAQDVERGRYIIFNQHAWQRESREMILRYADLDEHITNAVPGTLP